MLRRLFTFLYGSTAAEFNSSYGLEESVERLRAATGRPAFFPATREAAVGPVQGSSVRLKRSIPMISNPFKPFFYGRFEQRAGKVCLTGRFTMQPFVKMFISAWVGLALAVGFMSVVANGDKSAEAIGADIGAAVGMAVVGLAFVWLGKWFARNDIVWLSGVISGALDESRSPSLAPAAVAAGIQGSQRVPTVLLVVAGLLALSGLMAFLRALLSPQSAHWATSIAHRYFPSWSPRVVLATLAIALLVLAIGIYRRRLAAWRFGLFYLAASWVLMVVQVFADERFLKSAFLKVGFSAVALLVTAAWIRWWYAQRVHFQSPDPAAWPAQQA